MKRSALESLSRHLRSFLAITYGLLVAGTTLTGAAFAQPAPSTPSAPVLALPIEVAVVGDIACGPAIEPLPGECVDVSPLADGADLVLTLGDTTYPLGEPEEYEAFDATWGDLPILAIPGNHEYHTDDGQPFYDYFGDRTSDLGFWSVDLPGWRIYGLNSMCSVIDCGAQRRWLDGLRRDEPACTMALIHHPLRASYMGPSQENVGELYDALRRVDVILAGHAHVYERIDLEDSMLIVSGTGGRSLYEFPGGPRAGSVARYSDAYGLAHLTLWDGRYESAFVTMDGDERDRFGSAC